MSIRLIEHSDAEGIFSCIDSNRDYLRQWLSWVDMVKELKDAENFISRSLHAYEDKKEVIFTIIDDKEICGICGFNKLDFSCGCGYIGYWLDSAKQGRGVMTAVVSELLEYGFNRLGLEMCGIRAAVENSKSRAVAERLGFMYTGTVRRAQYIYGRIVDHAVYSLLKSDWLNNKDTADC